MNSPGAERGAGVKTPALLSLPDFSLEQELLGSSPGCCAGADEAGRGSLAGPLALGMVIFDRERFNELEDILSGIIRDSKQMNARQREKAAEIIRKEAVAWKVIMVSHRSVDRLNINGATELALRRGTSRLDTRPEMVLMDGSFSFTLDTSFHPVPGGDRRSLSISAASILAKVHRDIIMSKMDSIYPGYEFSAHKGYGTARHREIIRKIGPSPIHRMSYEPVRSLYGNDEGIIE
jgi:ribonuclease HII